MGAAGLSRSEIPDSDSGRSLCDERVPALSKANSTAGGRASRAAARCPGSGAGSWGFKGGAASPWLDRNV